LYVKTRQQSESANIRHRQVHLTLELWLPQPKAIRALNPDFRVDQFDPDPCLPDRSQNVVDSFICRQATAEFREKRPVTA